MDTPIADALLKTEPLKLTVHEAQLMITRLRKKWIFLACVQFAATETGAPAVSANVKVTRKAARQYLSEAYRGKARDALRVIVYDYPDCIFIGGISP